MDELILLKTWGDNNLGYEFAISLKESRHFYNVKNFLYSSNYIYIFNNCKYYDVLSKKNEINLCINLFINTYNSNERFYNNDIKYIYKLLIKHVFIEKLKTI